MNITSDTMIVELATSLSRQRALSDTESQWLEGALRREDRRNGIKRPFWEVKDDQALKRHLKRGRTVREISRIMDRSDDSIWSRIRFLRRKGKLGYIEQGPVAAGPGEE